LNRHLRAFILGSTFLAGFASVDSYAEPRVRRNVEVEFETIDGASLYEVQVQRKDDKKAKAMRFKSSTPMWSANIKPGLYIMQTRAYDDRGAPGEWSPPSDLKVRLPAIIVTSPAPDALIKAKDPSSEEIKFSWEPIPGATGYRLTFKNSDGSVTESKDLKEPEWTGKVPSGNNISWNAVAIDGNGEDGEAGEPYQLQLSGPALAKPRIDKPYSKFVQELTWSASPYANRYSYSLSRYNPKTKAWNHVESIESLKENKAVLDIKQPSGRYRMALKAHGKNRDDSPTAQLDFYMEGGFRTQEEFDKAQMRDGITKPTKYYAIASYLFTQINYSFRDYDNASLTSFKATGGTGRVGMGYQPLKSKWGGFAIVDLSGFVIQGNSFKFASGEIHANRKMEFGQGGLLLFGGGLFSKELPIVTGTVLDGYSSVGKVRSNGPHAGFTFWQPLKARYGLQLNGRAYYSLMGKAAGQDVEPALSYQYGLLGSYRLDKNTIGYAGYAYRKDVANFSADPKPSNYSTAGQINAISIDGHYINLMLEFSF
jgi:hypothetical protein